MNAHDLYQAGRLKDALAAAAEEVKKKPANIASRSFLCELSLINGDLERADTHLNVLATQDQSAAVYVAMLRQLVRAEQARRQFHEEGRMPELLADPPPALRLALEASIPLREGRPEQAAPLLQQAEEQRVRPSGTCNGVAFDDLRDLDDLTAGVFEVLTTTGKYYWIPIERVESIEFHSPERPLDLAWRRAQMTVRNGPEGEVFLPAVYAATYRQEDERLRLARATEWLGDDDQPMRGVGQRIFLVGEEAVPLMELQEISFRQS